MTLEESKQLEVKIANNILNNIPFAQVVQILSNEATRRAKDHVDNASEEELTKIKEDFEKAEAEAAAANQPQEEQSKIDLPDGE
jgi:hypothetical protein